MTMHLEHPKFTTTGKKRGRFKWASAEAKRQAEELKNNWDQIVEQTRIPVPSARPLTRPFPKLVPPPGRETPHIPSHDSGSGIAAKKASPVYTGTKIKGIGTMHKSNAVPIFSDEEAIAISQMRR